MFRKDYKNPQLLQLPDSVFQSTQMLLCLPQTPSDSMFWPRHHVSNRLVLLVSPKANAVCQSETIKGRLPDAYRCMTPFLFEDSRTTAQVGLLACHIVPVCGAIQVAVSITPPSSSTTIDG